MIREVTEANNLFGVVTSQEVGKVAEKMHEIGVSLGIRYHDEGEVTNVLAAMESQDRKNGRGGSAGELGKGEWCAVRRGRPRIEKDLDSRRKEELTLLRKRMSPRILLKEVLEEPQNGGGKLEDEDEIGVSSTL
ncbi:hypothetical protein VNO78_19574 [Psophocarpus tetragonolobus]|uniref:Uncharacterized protein n=1 Tax=Psophocarpus tetragonolobus TaxID=3891 RepID=A0AAN9XGQ2_PSOTE